MNPGKERICVALVITELEVGGAERCLVHLATALDRSRFEPVVYSLAPRPEPGRDQLAVRLQQADVPTHFIGVRRSWQFVAAMRKLRQLIDEQKADVVQSFLFHANVTAAMAVGGSDRPRLAMGVRVADPRRLRHRMERMLAGNADRIVCVSESVARFARDRARLPAEKLLVIPNGIDVAAYAEATPADLTTFGISPGRSVLVYVGRLDEQKGLDLFLEQTPELFQRLPEHDLLLVGDGPQRDALEAQAQRLGIAERVHFAGWQSDIPGILKAAALFVLPSRWEGMPNALMEAMACGLPVAATGAEGVAELLGDQAAWQLGSVEEQDFIDHIVNIAKNPDLARELGEKNRQRVAENFSLEAMVAQYQRLFEALAGV